MLRGHYFLLMFLTLVMIVFGTEYNFSISGLGDYGFLDEEDEAGGEDVGNMFTRNSVFLDVSSGNYEKGEADAEVLSSRLQEQFASSNALGFSNGVLASLIDGYASGKLYVTMGQAIYTMTKSDRAVSVILTLVVFLWFAAIFIFLKNVYSAVLRRIYLQARVYKKVHFTDTLYFAQVRKWLRASMTMFLMHTYQVLWSLTIIGGIIKNYSYKAVPYIVAENPAIGPNEAVTLSRRMMDGHKWELFKFQITMIGWWLLSFVTFGISDLFYGVAYRLACETEFYARVRRDAIDRGVEGVQALNDPYLFEPADKIVLYETYFNVVDEITLIHEERIELKGWRKFLADWFGVWFGSLDSKKKYDDLEGRRYSIECLEASMKGEAYPHWLNPLWPKKTIEKQGNFFFMRCYSLWVIFLLFIFFSFVGWTWEVALHFMQTGMMANRGKLYGPWLPIYGSGGIIALCLCSRFRKKPAMEFVFSTALCGVLEYMTAWMLEVNYNTRWWSYDGYFLNLHGRICAEGLLVFGVGCCAVVYLLAPVFDYLVSKLNKNFLIGLALALAVLFVGDSIYSSIHPNLAEGAVEKEQAPAEAGEEEPASEGAAEAVQPAGEGAAEAEQPAGEAAAEAGQTADEPAEDAGMTENRE